MYCELVLRMERMEAKLDKLLTLIEEPKTIVNNMTIEQWNNSLAAILTESSETIKGPPKPFTQIQDSEQFDNEYK